MKVKACKNCIHFDICHMVSCCPNRDPCEDFKDKAFHFDVPCEVGDKVYTTFWLDENDCELVEGVVKWFEIYGRYNIRMQVSFEEYPPRSIPINKIGQTVFLTIEEAEQLRKEMINGK